MKTIDEPRLEQDLGYRFGYLTEFMGFTPDDIAAIKSTADRLGPLVPQLVDAVYDKLHDYTATWRHFVPRQAGYEGMIPNDAASLGMEHEQIKFRKQHLARYLTALVTAAYDGKTVGYLDMVGKIHTPKAGNPNIVVPLVQMNALMGFVADAILATIQSLGYDLAQERRLSRSFSKLLWLQNDLISRHYTN